KKELFGMIWEYFAPFREKRKQLQNNKGEIAAILKKGAEKTRPIAQETLLRVKKAVGLDYLQ
ncbi:MAG: tryptophan--tRNA ligase, partial [Spirochaetota bacterium]